MEKEGTEGGYRKHYYALKISIKTKTWKSEVKEKTRQGKTEKSKKEKTRYYETTKLS